MRVRSSIHGRKNQSATPISPPQRCPVDEEEAEEAGDQEEEGPGLAASKWRQERMATAMYQKADDEEDLAT